MGGRFSTTFGVDCLINLLLLMQPKVYKFPEESTQAEKLKPQETLQISILLNLLQSIGFVLLYIALPIPC